MHKVRDHYDQVMFEFGIFSLFVSRVMPLFTLAGNGAGGCLCFMEGNMDTFFQFICIYSDTCLNRTSLGPACVFGLDRSLIYIG